MIMQHRHLTKNIFKTYDMGCSPHYYGVVWVAYNQRYGIGFWQQATKYYKSEKNLKRFNPNFA